MEWDLYLDESGSFEEKPYREHTLIGGFICPHSANVTDSLLSKWRNAIRNRGCAEAIFSVDMLKIGDQWHRVKPPSDPLKDKRTQRQKDICESIKDLPRYVFDHCCENVDTNHRSLENRWFAENWVLKQFINEIQKIGGQIVIFDNLKGCYQIDSNTTYLTILSIGILRLYQHLHEIDAANETVLHIHAASRLNVTYAFEKDKYDVSPLPGIRGNIGKELYVSQIKNCIFLNGGYALLEADSFCRSINSLEILNDSPNGDPHPATIVCDYICNGHYNARTHSNLKDTLSTALVFEVFQNQSFDLHLFNLDLIAQQKRWNYGLVELCSMGFPKSDTVQLFERMKQAHYDVAKSIPAFVESFRPYVSERITMPQIAERLELVNTELVHYINPQPYNELKANLLIYLDALYTHLGKTRDVHRVQKEFADSLLVLQEVTTREKLLCLFCNREIVTSTDAFQFERGTEYFNVLKSYYEKLLKNDEELMLDFLSIQNREQFPESKIRDYGTAIGSYLQLITHQMAMASGEEKIEITQRGKNLLPLVNHHFSLASDIARGYQNICDFYVQTKKYDLALENLYKSIIKVDNTSTDPLAMVLAIRKTTGDLINISKPGSKYNYLHLLQIIHMMSKEDASIDGVPWKELLFALLEGQAINIDNLSNLCGEYPGPSILWHLASCMARTSSSKMKVAASELLTLAYSEMKDCEMPIKAIAFAAKAEYIFLGYQQLLPGNKWEQKYNGLLTEYQHAVEAGCIPDDNDPFKETLTHLQQTSIVDQLKRVSEIVVY